MTGAWMINQVDYAGPEHLDADYVAGYDRKQGFPSPDDDVRALAEHGVLGPRATVVDLGAGTGSFAVAVAPQCSKVVAVDVSAAMLAHARGAADEAGVKNLEFVRAGFLDYVHQGQPADVVHSRNALHQLPDFWKGMALHRIAGVLRPGGILQLEDLVYDFSPAQAPEALERWMAGAATNPQEGYTRDDFATHIRTEFSTYSWLLESLLHATGFTILTRDVTGQIYAKYVCRRED
jgi:ubiquinone/menaquinone biosynthesis C-methylase UbiE